jgi:hypothetical protein
MCSQNFKRSWILLRIAADGEYAAVVGCLAAVHAGRPVSWRFTVRRLLAGVFREVPEGAAGQGADVGGLPGSRLMRESRVLSAAGLATDGEQRAGGGVGPWDVALRYRYPRLPPGDRV